MTRFRSFRDWHLWLLALPFIPRSTSPGGGPTSGGAVGPLLEADLTQAVFELNDALPGAYNPGKTFSPLSWRSLPMFPIRPRQTCIRRRLRDDWVLWLLVLILLPPFVFLTAHNRRLLVQKEREAAALS